MYGVKGMDFSNPPRIYFLLYNFFLFYCTPFFEKKGDNKTGAFFTFITAMSSYLVYMCFVENI